MKDGTPVIIFYDTFYCPWSYAYEKYHIEHSCLIIGINNNDLCCIDPNITSEIKTFDYNDFANAVIKHATLKINLSNIPVIDWRGILKQSALKMINKNGHNCPTDEMIVFANEISKMDVHTEILIYKEIWGSPLFRKISFIGQGRMNFSKYLKYLYKEYKIELIRCFYEKIEEIGRNWYKIRLMVIRIPMLENREQHLKLMAEKINEIACMEKNLALDIFCRVNDL